MENITPFPAAVAASVDVAVLQCSHRMHFDPAPMIRLFAEKDPPVAEEIACRMLEDIAIRLDMLQHALGTRQFDTMQRPARRIELVADRLGLTEVAVAAGHVLACVRQGDIIALAATLARLERGFDVAVAEIWNFREM